MDRISRIRNIIRWQELYQERKVLVSTYEGKEQKFFKLKEDFESAQQKKVSLTELQASLTQKITQEEERLDFILNQIETMEKDRDNLKMSRQIKSWEKDMDRYTQDREVIEAQFYYDKSKVGDISQELESIENTLTALSEEIKILEQEINTIKADTKDERESVEKEIDQISSKFDHNFVQYFDRLLVKNKGVVMAEIENDSCSGCNILLPTAYHGGDVTIDSEDLALLQCPNCFRYLHFPEDL